MPFKSQKQRAYMYARHPEVAKRWRKEHGPQRGLPERAGRADKRQRMINQFVKDQSAQGQPAQDRRRRRGR